MTDWLSPIIRCLQSTDYMCLATQQDGNPWASPVYFAWDQNLNLYFISMLQSRHMQSIAAQPVVSAAIYATNQDTQGDVIGLQISGTAAVLDQDQDIRTAFENYYARALSLSYVKYGDKVDSPYAYHPDWHFVRLSPQQIWLFDSAQFGDHRQIVPLTDILPLPLQSTK